MHAQKNRQVEFMMLPGIPTAHGMGSRRTKIMQKDAKMRTESNS